MKQTNFPILWGYHAVREALQNPKRRHRKLWLTRNAQSRFGAYLNNADLEVEIVDQEVISRKTGGEAVHQGVLLETSPLPEVSELAGLTGSGPIVVLDQVTDPHNVGAVLRSACVFDARGLILTERNSPPLSGLLAKAASGGLEYVPVILAKNLARTLSGLAELGYWRVGLDGDGETDLQDIETDQPLALVLGAEGKGLRRLTRENCDCLCKITAAGPLRSLNVSNAAAVALFCVQSKRKSPIP